MPTHQSLSGTTDQELLQRMIETHPDRFGADYWGFFDAHVAPLLPAVPTLIDIGCGPALLLRDFARRFPTAVLCGYDLTPAMIDHGQKMAWPGAKPTLKVHNAATEPLPHGAGTVHLVSMSSVLHVLDEPLPVLAEIRRVLAPGGVFLLNDWVRMPLPAYLAWRRETLREGEVENIGRGFRLFPAHAKYTSEDWRWLLGHAGFAVRIQTRLRPTHEIFVAVAGS